MAGVKTLSAVGILSRMLAVLCTQRRCGAIGFFLQSDSEAGAIRYRWPAWAPAQTQAFELPMQFRRLGVRDVAPKPKLAALMNHRSLAWPTSTVTGSPPAQSASASPGLLADSRTNCRTSVSISINDIKVVAVDDNADARELLKVILERNGAETAWLVQGKKRLQPSEIFILMFSFAI